MARTEHYLKADLHTYVVPVTPALRAVLADHATPNERSES